MSTYAPPPAAVRTIEQTRWRIDPGRSTVEFQVPHFWGLKTVKGQFERYEGTLDLSAQPAVELRIDAASLDTKRTARDKHLRSADFFDVEKYPAITFESRKIERRGDDFYRVLGELTIHGVTRPVELDAEYLGGGKDPWGNERIGFFAKTTLNRKDFGLNWNQMLETGGFLVSEQVEVSLDVQAVKAEAIGQAA